MIDPRVASGLRDLPPAVMIPRERMLAVFRQTFAGFGFVPIETPHIERMEVLTGKGAGSEEVLRQIFEVTNKGGTPGELALRFDLTVPLARFVAKHIDALGVPFKRYAIGSVFRGERPAKGRFREFVQCDFDTIGTESVVADAEIAQVIHAALDSAGVPDFTITLNNRKILDGFLDAQGLTGRSGPVLRALDKLAKIGRDAVIDELAKARRRRRQRADRRPGAAGPRLRRERSRRGRGLGTAPRPSLGSNPTVAAGHRQLAHGARPAHVRPVCPRAGSPSTWGWHAGSTITRASSSRRPSKAGRSLAASRRGADTTTWPACSRRAGCRGSVPRSASTACWRCWTRRAGSSRRRRRCPVLVANFPGTDPVVAFTMAARLRAVGIGAEVYPDPIPIGKQMGYGSTRGHKLAVIVGPDEDGQAGFQPAEPLQSPGGQGAGVVGAGRLGRECSADPQAGRGRLMSAGGHGSATT